MSCGCNSGQTPTPPQRQQPRSEPVYHQPTEGPSCPSSHCDSKFEGLGRQNGLEIPGLIGRCFRTLAGHIPGFLVNHPDGKTYVTDQPDIELIENASFQKNPDGSIVFQNGKPVKTAPPPFSWLVGMSSGIWKAIVGKSGGVQYPVWNGTQWELQDVPDWNGTRPLSDFPAYSTPCGISLLAIRTADESFTDECGNTGIRSMSRVGRVTYAPGVVGEIKNFAGPVSSIPIGYLLCDGAAISKTIWPELFDVIAYAWGGSGDSFQVPDLRGRFLRGLDLSAGRDSNTGRTIGSYQNDAVIQHKHSVQFSQEDLPNASFQLGLDAAHATVANEGTVSVYSQGGSMGDAVITSIISGIVVSGTIGNVTGTDKVAVGETRPANAAVNFIIYAGCQTNSGGPVQGG